MKRRDTLLISSFAMLSVALLFLELIQVGVRPVPAHEGSGRVLMGEGSGRIVRNTGGEIMMAAANEGPDSRKGDWEERSAEARSAYDRIQSGVHYGRISLKEGVLYTAKLLFAPRLIPPDSEYAPRPGETLIEPEESLTGFYKDLHRVKGELTEQEKSWLRSLSPDLEAIIEK